MPGRTYEDYLRPGQPLYYRDFDAFDGRFDILNIRGFSYFQRRHALEDIWNLTHCCWRAYRDALRMVEPALPFPAQFDTPFKPDLHWLLLAYDKLCIWYRETLFGLQLELFECNFSLELDRWMHFRDRYCFELIMREPPSVRATLEATGFLPRPEHSNGEYREFDNLITHWEERNSLPCLPTTSLTLQMSKRWRP
jgi:hypothetical protein